MHIETTIGHYLTSFTALNIPSDNGTGDWHYQSYFNGVFGRPPGPFLIAGKNLLSTNDIFESGGIYDASDKIPKNLVPVNGKVFAADHYRCVADMIHDAVFKGRQYRYSLDITGWFAGEKDRSRLDAYITSLATHLPEKDASELLVWFANVEI